MVYKLATNSTEQLVFILILGMKRPASKTQLELSKPAHGWAPGKLLSVSAVRKKKKIPVSRSQITVARNSNMLV